MSSIVWKPLSRIVTSKNDRQYLLKNLKIDCVFASKKYPIGEKKEDINRNYPIRKKYYDRYSIVYSQNLCNRNSISGQVELASSTYSMLFLLHCKCFWCFEKSIISVNDRPEYSTY